MLYVCITYCIHVWDVYRSQLVHVHWQIYSFSRFLASRQMVKSAGYFITTMRHYVIVLSHRHRVEYRICVIVIQQTLSYLHLPHWYTRRRIHTHTSERARGHVLRSCVCVCIGTAITCTHLVFSHWRCVHCTLCVHSKYNGTDEMMLNVNKWFFFVVDRCFWHWHDATVIVAIPSSTPRDGCCRYNSAKFVFPVPHDNFIEIIRSCMTLHAWRWRMQLVM